MKLFQTNKNIYFSFLFFLEKDFFKKIKTYLLNSKYFDEFSLKYKKKMNKILL